MRRTCKPRQATRLSLDQVGDLPRLQDLTHHPQPGQLVDQVDIRGHQRVQGAKQRPYLIDDSPPSHTREPRLGGTTIFEHMIEQIELELRSGVFGGREGVGVYGVDELGEVFALGEGVFDDAHGDGWGIALAREHAYQAAEESFGGR
jgi:hypothetical protein